jgi:PPOX class probable F420-dependent enzyme
MVLSESVRRILTGGHTAHLVTLNPDGSPQVSLVWVGLDGEEVVCAHLGTWKKVSNMQQEARVALSLETGEKTGGVVDYVVLSGRARITEGGAPELLQQLAQVYLGPGVKYPSGDHAPAGYITHIQIERVYGHGSWQTAD